MLLQKGLIPNVLWILYWLFSLTHLRSPLRPMYFFVVMRIRAARDNRKARSAFFSAIIL
jgi:hypothetical protein